MANNRLDSEALHQIWAPDRATWRKWLEAHHASEPGVWLYQWKKSSGNPSITWSEAVDEALCFGWIDSTRRAVDEQSFKQYFAPRKARSNWSQINKEKVERLIAEGKMTQAGLTVIVRAKTNGSWTNLDEVERDVVPDDLNLALDELPAARAYFDELSRMKRWEILYWFNGAKRDATRADRIRQIVEAAAQGQRPPRFRQ
jgi:uncharacterized protein YdeI (YjbR/CyaY-like superfamily)